MCEGLKWNDYRVNSPFLFNKEDLLFMNINTTFFAFESLLEHVDLFTAMGASHCLMCTEKKMIKCLAVEMGTEFMGGGDIIM